MGLPIHLPHFRAHTRNDSIRGTYPCLDMDFPFCNASLPYLWSRLMVLLLPFEPLLGTPFISEARQDGVQEKN